MLKTLIAAVLILTATVSFGCSQNKMGNCPANCDKPCCTEKAGGEMKGDMKAQCPPDCDKPCCADKKM